MGYPPPCCVELPYRPRQYQQTFETAMFNGMRYAFLLYHRRAGKDIACFNFLVNEALKKRGLYVYSLPDHTQAKKVIWKGLTEDGDPLIKFIPEQLITRTNNTELLIELVNGSSIQLVGAKTYNSFRGVGALGCVLSEYAYQHPALWERVLEPMISKTNGWAVFNTTPNGKNHAYDLWNHALANPSYWFTQKLTVEDTNLISQEAIERERRRGKPEEIIQQEYYCSFEAGAVGTYYARLIADLWDTDHVKTVHYDDTLPVHTSWDLGIGDATSIWFFQLIPGGGINFIRYFESSGEPLSFYRRYLQDQAYCYGMHFFPHDVRARELGTGASREEVLRKLGIDVTVTPRLSVDDGIQAVRSILPRCYFDLEKCALGVKHLENYRKRWSDTLFCFLDYPLHDEHCHAADAMRMAAINIVRGIALGGMDPDRADKLWHQYGARA